MVRCLYCGKEIAAGEYCSEDCRKKTESFQNSAEKNAKWFILCIVISFTLILVPLMTGDTAYITLMFIGMGLTLLVFPYVTPETNAWRGVRTGIKIARCLGAAMALSSALILAVCLLM